MKSIKWTVGIAAVGLGLLLISLTATTRPTEAERDTQANLQRVFKDLQYENAKELAALRQRLIVLRYGDAFVDEYYRCTSDPPKHKANQVRCQKMAARVQRDDAEAEAREKRERENW